MGSCFSSDSEYDQQQYSPKAQAQPDENEIYPSSTEEVFSIPPKQDVWDLRQNPRYINVDSFTYDEMRMATKLFRKDAVLGEGGFGVVYKGIIDDTVRSGYTTTEVAVKVLNPEGMQGDSEWLTEVNYLGHLQHPNVVKLIGYCCEEQHRLLVYEYMANGSVEDHLFRNGHNTLTWAKRMKIALDVAKGLSFLHNARRRPVIFRDLKTSNILLDVNFNAKLSDFGLAKDGPIGADTHVSTKIKGTCGYTAPEYYRTGHLTAICDIYAFGVLLLELLTGQRAVDLSRPSRERFLIDWARPPLIRGKTAALSVFDPRMKGQYISRNAVKVAEMTYRCLRFKATLRPPMRHVLETLESVQVRERVTAVK